MTCARCRQRPVAPGRYSKLCLDCRYRRKFKRRKYAWTPEAETVLRERYEPRIRGRAAEIAALIGIPAWSVKRRAAELGLSRPADRREWSAEEVAFLVEWAGRRTVAWIARNMPRGRRTIAAVTLKIKRLNISRRAVPGVYSARRLARCFGVEVHAVSRWVHAGLLSADRRDRPSEIRPNSALVIEEPAVVRFVLEHASAYDLARVDHLWLVNLMRAAIDRWRQPCSVCERDIVGEPIVEERPSGDAGEIERHLLCVDCAERLGAR